MTTHFKKISVLLLLFLVSMNFVQAQENEDFSKAQEKIYAPSEGKAVIYILRTSSLGALMNFRFYEGNKYLGKFNGTNYLRYECNPGKSLFWVRAENVDFIETDLEAGKIYLVEANPKLGAFSSGVKFKTVDYEDEAQMKRIYKLLAKKEPKTFTEEKLQKDKNRNTKSMQSGMRYIMKKRKEGEDLKYITPEMNYKQ